MTVAGSGVGSDAVYCGGDRVTHAEEPQGILAVQYDSEYATVMATLSRDGAPVTGLVVEFARSISGRATDYTEFTYAMNTTDENGRTALKLSGANITGY